MGRCSNSYFSKKGTPFTRVNSWKAIIIDILPFSLLLIGFQVASEPMNITQDMQGGFRKSECLLLKQYTGNFSSKVFLYLNVIPQWQGGRQERAKKRP